MYECATNNVNQTNVIIYDQVQLSDKLSELVETIIVVIYKTDLILIRLKCFDKIIKSMTY